MSKFGYQSTSWVQNAVWQLFSWQYMQSSSAISQHILPKMQAHGQSFDTFPFLCPCLSNIFDNAKTKHYSFHHFVVQTAFVIVKCLFAEVLRIHFLSIILNTTMQKIFIVDTINYSYHSVSDLHSNMYSINQIH